MTKLYYTGHPANSWMSAGMHNDSYFYHLSLHCPFQNCISHQSHLNFSTLSSQFNYNRSGALCGRCNQSLSTVFTSPHGQCQLCSNVYLFLIVPIAIAGLVLVLLLFVLNLTVSNGNINPVF